MRDTALWLGALLAIGSVSAIAGPGARAQDDERPPIAGGDRAPSRRADEPYDWPLRARSLEARTFARIDTSLATYESGDRHGYALAQLFGFGVAASDWLVIGARGGWSFSREPSELEGTIAANLEISGSAIARLSPELRLGGHLSVVLPTGSAQGDDVPFVERRARQEAQRARMGIDAPLFLTGYTGVAGAVSFGWVHEGLIAQAELGLEPVVRVSGSERDEVALAVQGAVHVAYFVIPEWSVGVDLTHHQWAVAQPAGGAPGSITAIVVGTRAHARIGDVGVRPGIGYSHALGGALQQVDEHVLVLDVVLDL